MFWFDDWVGMGPSAGLFPQVFRVASNKESSLSDVMRGKFLVVDVSSRRSLRQLEVQYGELLSLLSNIFI